MPTLFPHPHNWKNPFLVDIDIPTEIQEDVYQGERRSGHYRSEYLLYGSGATQFSRTYKLVHSTYGKETDNKILDTLALGSKDTFLLPYWPECMVNSVGLTNNGTSTFTLNVLGDHVELGKMLFRPRPLDPTPFPLFSTMYNSPWYVMRTSKQDPIELAEAKAMNLWSLNIPLLVYAFDSDQPPWVQNIDPEDEKFFWCDEVVPLDVSEKAYTDNKIDYTITWQSV